MQFAIGDDRVALTVPDRQALLSIVETRLAARQGFALATMNVDHLEKLRSDADFRTAYAQHDLIVADGNPVVWLARLGGQRVSLVPGSDLVQPLCALAARLDRGLAILAGTEEGGLWLSSDRGASWRSGGLAGQAIYNLLPDPLQPERVIAATARGLYAATLPR